jgi:hypothetical protein
VTGAHCHCGQTVLVTVADSRLKLHDGERGGIEHLLRGWGLTLSARAPAAAADAERGRSRFDWAVMRVLGPPAAGSVGPQPVPGTQRPGDPTSGATVRQGRFGPCPSPSPSRMGASQLH